MSNTSTANSSFTTDTGGDGPTIGGTAVSLVLILVSSLVTTFGLFFQKIAQERFDYASKTFDKDTTAEEEASVVSGVESDGDSDKPALKTRNLEIGWTDKEIADYKCRSWLCWFAGFMGITLLSFGLDLYSMATLGQSLVVPVLASLQIAENNIFAPIILKEKLNKAYDITATVLIFGGAIMCAFGGPTEKLELNNITEILELFTDTNYIIFQVVTVILLVLALAFMYNPDLRCLDKWRFVLFAYATAFFGGTQNLFLKGTRLYVGTTHHVMGHLCNVANSFCAAHCCCEDC